MPKTKTPQSNSSFRMSAEEVAAIRQALRTEGIPIYPQRILAEPAKADLMTTSRQSRTQTARR